MENTVGLLVVVLGLFALVGGFLALLSIPPRTRDLGPRFWKLYALEVVIVAPILGAVVAGGWLADLILAALIGRSAFELFIAGRDAKGVSLRTTAPLAAIVGWLAVFVWVWLWTLDEGLARLLALTYILVEVSDAVALLVGGIIGGKKPFPTLSPNKTLAGCIAGTGVAGILGVLIVQLLSGLGVGAGTVLVLAIVASGFLGDLMMSAIKRCLGRKDFAPVLKDHGGVLDIYDSFFFSVPPSVMLAVWLM